MLEKHIFISLALAMPAVNSFVFAQGDPFAMFRAMYRRRAARYLLNASGFDFVNAGIDGSSSTDDMIDQLAPADVVLIDDQFQILQNNLKNHGCQCSRFFATYYTNPDVVWPLIGGNNFIDELDEICLNWYKNRHCMEKLTPSLQLSGGCGCDPNMDALSYEVTDEEESSCVMPGYRTCSTDTCLVDADFINELFAAIDPMQLLQDSIDQTGESSGPFRVVTDADECPKNRGGGNAEERACTGEAPAFFIVKASTLENAGNFGAGRRRRSANVGHENCAGDFGDNAPDMVCAAGYHASSDGRCVDNGGLCHCSNGQPWQPHFDCQLGQMFYGRAHNICSVCDAGYSMTSDNTCELNN